MHGLSQLRCKDFCLRFYLAAALLCALVTACSRPTEPCAINTRIRRETFTTNYPALIEQRGQGPHPTLLLDLREHRSAGSTVFMKPSVKRPA
jgi:hypothetical protein